MEINEGIFKSYDIRGVYPTEVHEEVAHHLGRIFTDFVGSKKIIIGRDVRTSGPALREHLVKGLLEQGAEIIDIGMVSTDMFYFACGSMNLPGIQITASHNPKEFNGFKMVKEMPDMVSGADIKEFFLTHTITPSDTEGSIETKNIEEDFVAKVKTLFDYAKIPPLKVVVDPANGMGGVAFDAVFKDTPLEIIKLNFEPDGTFPNHGGDPLKEENRKELQERVIAEKADLGFAFDPDADRFFAIDKHGVFVPGDFMTALFAQYLIEEKNVQTVVYDIPSSHAVATYTEHAGGTAIASRVGSYFIKEKMKETAAPFAGELSGHYYFSSFFGADSGVIAALLLLEMLGHYGTSLDTLLQPIRSTYYKTGEINFMVADIEDIMQRIESAYPDGTVSRLDGVKIVYPDFWLSVRRSNTESKIRLYIEASTQERLDEKRDEVIALVEASS